MTGPVETEPLTELVGHSDVELATAVAEWLRQHLPPEWVRDAQAGLWTQIEHRLANTAYAGDWFATLGAAGLATPTWPREYNGLEMSSDEAAVVADELLRYRAGRPESDFVGVALAGPSILQWGTDEQKAQYLPPLATARQRWCQLFSEPGAGSDLASLSTRAVRRADGSWLVNGQKVWSSHAQVSDFGLLLARTDGSVPKHRGITYLLLDMRSPGVEPRPLRQMTGHAEFNEVFLTDVVVPDSARLGPVGAGWSVAVSTLMNERSGLSGRPAVGEGRAEELITRARETGTWADPLLRDRLITLFVEEKATQMTTVRAYAQASFATPGAEGSIRKLANALLDEQAAQLATELEPAGAIAWQGKPARAIELLLAAKRMSIAGGTSEIQRSIIGERLLGLEKDPDPTRGQAFDERSRE